MYVQQHLLDKECNNMTIVYSQTKFTFKLLNWNTIIRIPSVLQFFRIKQVFWFDTNLEKNRTTELNSFRKQSAMKLLDSKAEL